MRRWDPFRDLAVLQEKVNRAFNEQISQDGPEAVNTRSWAPVVDVLETEADVIVRADLPGLQKDAIDIEVTSEQLSIRGERKIAESDTDKYVRMERPYGPFQRTFSIGVPVQPDKVQATYKDGILEIIIPKTEEVKPKKITINVE